MKRSDGHVLTTHTGSLPRPPEILAAMRAREEGTLADEAAFEAALARNVADIVARQVRLGIDIVNDGECGKPTFNSYQAERLSGYERPARPEPSACAWAIPERRSTCPMDRAAARPAMRGQLRLRFLTGVKCKEHDSSGKPVMLATLTSKGQITLPKELRDRLGLAAGSVLDFDILPDNSITARTVTADARRIRGILKSPHAKPPTIEKMDAAVGRHLRAKHAPAPRRRNPPAR